MEMKKRPLRTLSVLLTVAVLFGVLACLPVGAEEIFSDGYYWYTVKNGEATITQYIGEGGDVTIPSTLGGYPVTAIGAIHSEGLTSVIIPEGVTSIGDWAFRSCPALTSISIPASVTSIGEGAFYACSNLEHITVQESNAYYKAVNDCLIEKATDTLLQGCKNSVIPDDIKGIGKDAFAFCDNLTSVVIPNSVTSIGEHAFYACSNLEHIIVQEGNAYYKAVNDCLIEKATDTLLQGCKSSVIPEGVKGIGEEAFAFCDKLTSVAIPNSVTSIGVCAFNSCGLTSIVIPKSVIVSRRLKITCSGSVII